MSVVAAVGVRAYHALAAQRHANRLLASAAR
jgi:hypothetical protein